MNNKTTFLYLKVLDYIEDKKYKLEHTLFHLHRYLTIYTDETWERIFDFTREEFCDDLQETTLRTLLHHYLIQPKTFVLTKKGSLWLKKKEAQHPSLNQLVNDFFEQYDGEFAYENSCYTIKKKRTIACHLCTNQICLQEQSLFSILKPNGFLKIKNPCKNYSKTTAN